MMSKEKKQVYISEMTSQLDKAEAVIVAPVLSHVNCSVMDAVVTTGVGSVKV